MGNRDVSYLGQVNCFIYSKSNNFYLFTQKSLGKVIEIFCLSGRTNVLTMLKYKDNITSSDKQKSQAITLDSWTFAIKFYNPKSDKSGFRQLLPLRQRIPALAVKVHQKLYRTHLDFLG